MNEIMEILSYGIYFLPIFLWTRNAQDMRDFDGPGKTRNKGDCLGNIKKVLKKQGHPIHTLITMTVIFGFAFGLWILTPLSFSWANLFIFFLACIIFGISQCKLIMNDPVLKKYLDIFTDDYDCYSIMHRIQVGYALSVILAIIFIVGSFMKAVLK